MYLHIMISALRKVVQQPLENPEQLVMIAGKEDQLHACCKRYMTLATAVDTIEVGAYNTYKSIQDC